MNNFCEINSDFKGKYKKRAIYSFVSATEKIMMEEGLDKVTIRKISDLSGYSSATIYSYFDNIEHLILFSSMKFLEEYIKAVPEYADKSNSAIDLFKNMWDCFCKFSFQKADVFSTMFFTKVSNNARNFMRDYYCVYPIEDDGYPEVVQQMLRENNLYKRNIVLIQGCIEEGTMLSENGDEINEMTIFIYESLLHRVRNEELSPEEAEMKMKRYIKRILTIGMLPREAD